jgi:uncharacterized membrane protein YfhO
MSAVGASGNAYIQQYAQQIPDLKEFLFGKMVSDWIFGAFLLLIAIAVVWAYSKSKLSKTIFYIAMLALLLIDLWRVDWRRFEVQDKMPLDAAFPRTDLVQFLQKDKDIFRIVDLTADGGSNKWAYHRIQNCGGYSAAKMRSWQDMSDVCGNGSTAIPANPFLWNLFNVKYIISDRQLGGAPVFQSQSTGRLVYQNPMMLPRATFVGSVEKTDKMSILNHIKNQDFDPFKVAYVEENLPTAIDIPQEGASARVSEYKMHNIKIDVNATGNNLLLISEMDYPNWHAFLDGKETEIFKTNFAFRSVIIPAGKHVLEMKYIDEAFNTGKTISWILSFLVLGTLIFGIWLDRRKKKNVA